MNKKDIDKRKNTNGEGDPEHLQENNYVNTDEEDAKKKVTRKDSGKAHINKKRQFKKDLTEGRARMKQDFKENMAKLDRKTKVKAFLKLILLLIIVVAVPIYFAIFQQDFLHRLKAIDYVIEYLESYKTASVFIYLAFQIVQIIICIIPGQIFQFAAGCLYGVFWGILLSLLGAFCGTTITFFLAQFLGQDAMHMFFSTEKFDSYVKKLNSQRAYTVVFIVYFIPGFPKDLVTYAAGTSSMRYKPFIILSLIGRTPGMIGSLMIGAFYYNGHYIAMWVMIAVAFISFGVCILLRKQLKKIADNFYDKLVEDKEKKENLHFDE